MALFVLKNNSAVLFYQRLGFSVVRETPTKFVMRRSIVDASCTSPREQKKCRFRLTPTGPAVVLLIRRSTEAKIFQIVFQGFS
jgi:hypothetical protein